ncbi:hypothetical protein ACTJJT_01080 [Pseudomonas sp. 22373]|uniref:hypothetical protein n=1 Tax=Pseudomonas sp. 22373 TaxID=3453914 RepID=UPI001AF1BF4F|nr:hypothetical protein JQN61_04455 [Pseudomonas putida]
MTDINRMREQFEAAAKEQGLSLTRTQQALRFANGHSRVAGDYVALETLCAWWAWQASRSTIEVKLPAQRRIRHMPMPDENGSYNEALENCRDAIEAQGLKVAP